jgi:hypothetical protein
MRLYRVHLTGVAIRCHSRIDLWHNRRATGAGCSGLLYNPPMLAGIRWPFHPLSIGETIVILAIGLLLFGGHLPTFRR